MLNDLQFALRQLLKKPRLSLVAVLTIALTIGANTAIFSAIDAVLRHPFPYPDPDRVAPTAPDYAEFRRQTTGFSEIAAVTTAAATLTGDGAHDGERTHSAMIDRGCTAKSAVPRAEGS